MNILIQKFGGTSVSSNSRRKQVVSKVKKALADGFKPVVVVSAMGRKGAPYATDTLLSLVDDNFKADNRQAVDLLLCCGEFISTVVMCNELNNAGIKSVPLTGGQAGIITDDNYNSAELTDTKPKLIESILAKDIVPVVAGFQGINKDGILTTLGRGGSDTSAAILGVMLKAKEIQIYTDVDGIMTADPRIVHSAERIPAMSYNETFQFAEQGAKVIHPRAVETAMKGNIPLVIKNTMSDSEGTIINSMGYRDSKKLITGITHVAGRVQISIRLRDNTKENYKHILKILGDNNISLDLINIFPNEKIFTIDEKDKDNILNILTSMNMNYTLIEKCCKISIIGSMIRGIPGIVAKIVDALEEKNIDVLQTADSHTTIWCLIKEDNVNEAIQILHDIFL